MATDAGKNTKTARSGGEASRLLRLMRYPVAKRHPWPLYVVVFVTERCPAECGHCLVGDARYPGPEIRPAEYGRMAKSMKPFYFLLLTGGEPFVREDLAEIAHAFLENCVIANVGIPTNGAYPVETERAVRRMTESFPGVQFGIDVSIDGIGKEHDALRGAPGLSARAEDTFFRLKKLAAKTKNLNANVAVTLSAANQDRVDALVDYLFHELGVTNVNPLLVRGRPRNPAALGVRPEAYHRLVTRLDEETALCGGGYEGYAAADAINAVKRVRSETIENMVRTGKFQMPCKAARLGVVVRANGDVTACELRDTPMGNLFEEKFDFAKIWKSERRRTARREIEREKCFCTYECFNTLNVLFNTRMFPKVFSEYLDIRNERKRGGLRYEDSLREFKLRIKGS